MKTEKITRKYSFSKEERDTLQNIQIGIINAQATLEGLSIYKNVTLGQTYKRLGIDGEAPKGFTKSISYNLALNIIEYTQEPEKKNDIKTKSGS